MFSVHNVDNNGGRNVPMRHNATPLQTMSTDAIVKLKTIIIDRFVRRCAQEYEVGGNRIEAVRNIIADVCVSRALAH